jgi:transposase
LGNYLQMADVKKIEALLDLGWSQRRIVREVGCRHETVGRYQRLREAKPANLIAGSVDRENRPNPIAGSEIEMTTSGPISAAQAHHDFIAAGIKRGLTARRIWQDLVEERAYTGGYLTVQRYVRRIRRARPEVADVMEHPPGEEAQIDFFRSPALVLDGEGKWRRPWVMRMTLSCSRHGYEEGIWRQQQVPFLRVQEHAFEAFGGVPKVVRLDNTRAGVARACLYDPDLSEVYEAFAHRWGFVALPSRPSHPQEQGVQERSGGYVKDNALKGRRFESLEEHNQFLRRWNRTVAQLRIHGTTRRQVLTHFLEVEKPALQPLPGVRFEMFQVGTRTVHMDGFIEVEGAYYPVPHHLLQQEVRVRWNDRLVRVFHDGREVRVHAREHRPGIFVTVRPGDRPAHKPARQQAYQENLLARAGRVGEKALAWARAAIEERDVRAYRLLQGMLSLTRSHPQERVDWACGVALENRSFRYLTLRRLVETVAERTPEVRLRLTQEHELIRPLQQYAQLTLEPVS